MSDSPETTLMDNGSEITDQGLIDEGIQVALARAAEATGEPIPAIVRDVIASKVATIVDGMEGVKRNHNGRYPSHSIDQVVSAISPLVSAACLRIKTEVLDIEPFTILHDMPFWRESNGKQEMYQRDVHLFKMLLRFTIIDGVTGQKDIHHWAHVFQIGRAEQDQGKRMLDGRVSISIRRSAVGHWDPDAAAKAGKELVAENPLLFVTLFAPVKQGFKKLIGMGIRVSPEVMRIDESVVVNFHGGDEMLRQFRNPFSHIAQE